MLHVLRLDRLLTRRAPQGTFPSLTTISFLDILHESCLFVPHKPGPDIPSVVLSVQRKTYDDVVSKRWMEAYASGLVLVDLVRIEI